jgi:hypothetical protein
MWWSDHHGLEVSPARPKQNHCKVQWFFLNVTKDLDHILFMFDIMGKKS